jgi:hypothetical protein
VPWGQGGERVTTCQSGPLTQRGAGHAKLQPAKVKDIGSDPPAPLDHSPPKPTSGPEIQSGTLESNFGRPDLVYLLDPRPTHLTSRKKMEVGNQKSVPLHPIPQPPTTLDKQKNQCCNYCALELGVSNVTFLPALLAVGLLSLLIEPGPGCLIESVKLPGQGSRGSLVANEGSWHLGIGLFAQPGGNRAAEPDGGLLHSPPHL